MATVNRLKNKKKQPTSTHQDHQDHKEQQQLPNSPYAQKKRTKIFSSSFTPTSTLTHTPQIQQQYQSYYPLKQANPIGIQYSLSLFPHNIQMHNKYNLPLGFTFSPLLSLQNQILLTNTMDKCIDMIPRCAICCAYMNCYNRIEGNRVDKEHKKFTCFLCNTYAPKLPSQNQSQTKTKNNYIPYEQLNSSIYQANGSDKFYQNIAGEECYVFLIDIAQQACTSVILQYTVAAMKQVLSRPQLDDIYIYIYAYDEVVYQMDFTGEQTKCTIMDRTIQGYKQDKPKPIPLKQCRDKIFVFLDQLQEFSQGNHRKGSNFMHAFDYVYKMTKNMGAKYFIIQINQLISGELIFVEDISKLQKNNPQLAAIRQNPIPPKSLLQTRNKIFFDKYATQLHMNGNSISIFIFAKNYKNIKILADCSKLTNSDIKYYSKDASISQIQLNKYYYQLSYLLGCTYFRDIRVEFIISQGWHFTTVYSNSFRIRERITFSMPYAESSKKFYVLVSPSKNVANVPPHCTVQLIINYRYKGHHYTTVATSVQNVTGYADKMYEGIDACMCISALAKAFFTNIRADPIQIAKKKIVQSAAKIYLPALQHFKSYNNIPDSVIAVISSTLSMMKSMYAQPEVYVNTPLFDRGNAQRIFFQFCSAYEIAMYFVPYVFVLSQMDESMCRSDGQFQYPPTIQARFNNVKEGLFLLDDGISLYLFIARNCDQDLLTKVLGKSKFSKNDVLNEQTLNQQDTFQAQQVRTLIQFLREQKSYGWIPLYIVRCGENTLLERSFYLHFYTQKYDQFKNYKHSIEEYKNQLVKLQNFL